MIRFLQATANLIGSVVALLILGFVGFGVWEVYQRLNHGAVLEKKVNELQQELQNRDQKIADLERKITSWRERWSGFGRPTGF